jgi:hypothetical protein
MNAVGNILFITEAAKSCLFILILSHARDFTRRFFIIIIVRTYAPDINFIYQLLLSPTDREEITEERLFVSWNIRKLSATNVLEDAATISRDWRHAHEEVREGENGCGAEIKNGN